MKTARPARHRGSAVADPSLTVQFRATVDDMVAGNDLIWRDVYHRAAVAVPVFALFVGLTGWALGDGSALPTAVVLATVFCALFWSGRVRRGVTRRLTGRRYASLAGNDEVVMTLSPRGIRSQRGTRTTVTPWADVTGVLEDERMIVLLKGHAPTGARRWLRGRPGLLVPTHAFATPAALEAFRAAVAQGRRSGPTAGAGR